MLDTDRAEVGDVLEGRNDSLMLVLEADALGGIRVLVLHAGRSWMWEGGEVEWMTFSMIRDHLERFEA